MRIICTYCSAAKDPDKGEVPAHKRYISARIDYVRKLADEQRVSFFVLSGQYGLVGRNESVPLYDHLLLESEVCELAEKVKEQLIASGVEQVDYYTRSYDDANLMLYMRTIEDACKSCDVVFEFHTLDENKNPQDWKHIAESAADAGQTLMVDRTQGERLFEGLLRQFPEDGMVYYERANALKRMGEFELAKNDYSVAKGLFPLERWKREAQAGIQGIIEELAEGGTISEARRRINNIDTIKDGLNKNRVLSVLDQAITDPVGVANEIRKFGEMVLVGIMEDENIKEDEIAKDQARQNPKVNMFNIIRHLSRKKVIPRFVVGQLDAIREIGNYGSHPNYPLGPSDTYVSITALVALLEWRNVGRRS